MTLFIPSVGTKLVLNHPWTFDVHFEHRNFSLLKHMGKLDTSTPHWQQTGMTWWHTLKAGCILRVERVYVRTKNNGYDSVTFRLLWEEGNPVKGVRFWVKLDAANLMQCGVTSDGEGLR